MSREYNELRNFSVLNSISVDQVNASYYGDYISYYQREYTDAIGEINLWRAVILQALIDLKTKSNKKRMRPKKKEAYDWFTKKENKEDVKMICNLAGINFNKVNACVNKIIGSDDYKI